MSDKQDPWADYRRYRRYVLTATMPLLLIFGVVFGIFTQRAPGVFDELSRAGLTQAKVRVLSGPGTERSYRVSTPALLAGIQSVMSPSVRGDERERRIYPIEVRVKLYKLEEHVATVNLYVRSTSSDVIVRARLHQINRFLDAEFLLQERREDVRALIRAIEEGGEPIADEEFWES